MGYGDIDFHADGTKMFLCGYILGSIGLLVFAFHNCYSWFETTKTLARRRKQLAAQSDLRLLANSASAHGMNKFEVTLAILARTGKLDLERDIAPLLRVGQVREPSRPRRKPLTSKYLFHFLLCRRLMPSVPKIALAWINRYQHTFSVLLRFERLHASVFFVHFAANVAVLRAQRQGVRKEGRTD